MPSPEHIFHRPRVAFAPDHKTGSDASGQPGTEDPHKKPLFETHETEQIFLDPDPSSIQQPNSSLAQPQIEHHDLSETQEESFIWTEDLSPNGQKLWLLLIGDTGVMEFLQWKALEEGWDLEAAIKELEEHKVLDKTCLDRLRIIREYRGYD